MSLTEHQYRFRRRLESACFHRLIRVHPLSARTIGWMDVNCKRYSEETLSQTGVREGVLQCWERRNRTTPILGPRRLVFSDPCIVIPAGPVFRCYTWTHPKGDRWRVVPAGHEAQWLGDLSGSEVLLTEGEWDWLRALDERLSQAATHTAGAMTWLRSWTPRFAGKRVWICYDRDEIGRRGALKAARCLHGVADQIRIVDLPLPGTPDAKDLSDFFRLGGNVGQFRELLQGAWRYERPIFYRKR